MIIFSDYLTWGCVRLLKVFIIVKNKAFKTDYRILEINGDIDMQFRRREMFVKYHTCRLNWFSLYGRHYETVKNLVLILFSFFAFFFFFSFLRTLPFSFFLFFFVLVFVSSRFLFFFLYFFFGFLLCFFSLFVYFFSLVLSTLFPSSFLCSPYVRVPSQISRPPPPISSH